MSERSPIVLVHGAWSDARTWANVVPVLTEAGHRVLAIDLPGHGHDPTPAGNVSLADYGKRVAEVLKDTGRAVLVGHSMGGMAISAGAELAPKLVRKLVYIAAFLPRNGQSLLDLIKLQTNPGLRDCIRPADTAGATVLDPANVGDVLFQDATADQKKHALAQLTAQPNRAQTDAIVLSPARFGQIPRAYIRCEQDRTVTPALQSLMIKHTPCAEVFALETGHVPQLTRPAKLAGLISQLGES